MYVAVNRLEDLGFKSW